jgi:hypothetical protein
MMITMAPAAKPGLRGLLPPPMFYPPPSDRRAGGV